MFAIIKCLCLKVQQSFFTTNKLYDVWVLQVAIFPISQSLVVAKLVVLTGSYMIQVMSIGTSVSRIGFYGSNQEKLW
jgi:hypothetical protein